LKRNFWEKSSLYRKYCDHPGIVTILYTQRHLYKCSSNIDQP